jgi:hypothetical protein
MIAGIYEPPKGSKKLVNNHFTRSPEAPHEFTRCLAVVTQFLAR